MDTGRVPTDGFEVRGAHRDPSAPIANSLQSHANTPRRDFQFVQESTPVLYQSRIILILIPAGRVAEYIFAGALEIIVVANNMFEIIALP